MGCYIKHLNGSILLFLAFRLYFYALIIENIQTFCLFFFQENAPLEEVFQHLKCTREGLNSNEVQERLDLFGYNKLEEKKVF